MKCPLYSNPPEAVSWFYFRGNPINIQPHVSPCGADVVRAFSFSSMPCPFFISTYTSIHPVTVSDCQHLWLLAWGLFLYSGTRSASHMGRPEVLGNSCPPEATFNWWLEKLREKPLGPLPLEWNNSDACPTLCFRIPLYGWLRVAHSSSLLINVHCGCLFFPTTYYSFLRLFPK